MKIFAAIVARDVRLSLRAGGGAGQSLVFFGLSVLIFALAAGPERALLARMAAPAIWASAIFATFLSLDRLFQGDAEDGDLDILVQRSDLLAALVLAKAVAHWLTACLPLIVAAPLMGLLLSLPAAGYGPLVASLIAGSPALSLTGAMVGALTFPIRRAGLLITILAAPLLAPVVIFGVDAAGAASAGRFASSLLFLCSVSLLSLIVAPFVGALAIRFNLE